jgi:hypothetical protein
MTLETATTASAALSELASALRCRSGLGVIAGARGRICATGHGLVVEPGATAPLSALLLLVQSGAVSVSESFRLARLPTQAEIELLRALLGITQGTI